MHDITLIDRKGLREFGLLMRFFRNDPMARKFEQAVESYRIASHEVPKKNVERPFLCLT